MNLSWLIQKQITLVSPFPGSFVFPAKKNEIVRDKKPKRQKESGDFQHKMVFTTNKIQGN